jgi:cellular nucleic acid-binding protein
VDVKNSSAGKMSFFANGIDGIAPQQNAKACHICGEIGHLKRDCPQAGGGGGGRNAGKVCHNCGQPGHLKRDCPQLPKLDGDSLADGMANLSTGPKPSRGRRMTCYNCGQVGAPAH